MNSLSTRSQHVLEFFRLNSSILCNSKTNLNMILIIVIIATVVMFVNLGTMPFFDPNESVYAQTAKEMIAYGDFISPRIYGDYWYDKPPMYYWLTAGSFQIFGISEFSARFPSAALAVAGALAVYFFCRELLNLRAAFLSAIILTTSIEYFYLGKAAVTDMTLTFCITVCLLSFLTKRYYLFYLFAGLAVLTKGPVGFLLPCAIVGIYLVLTRQLYILSQIKLIKGLILFAIVTLPWYILMYTIHGQIFIDTFLGFHNLTRFTSPEHKSGAVWYYFIPVLIVGFFPWTAVLFQSVWTSLRKNAANQRNTLIFLNIWAGFIFLFFSVSQTKLVSYILPMFPAIAILAGWYIDRFWDGYKKSLLGWGTLILILAGFVMAFMLNGTQKFPALAVGIIPTAASLAVMVVVCLIFSWKGHAGGVFWTKTLTMVFFLVTNIIVTAPAIVPMFTTKYAAQEFLRAYDGQSPVYVSDFLRPGFVIYTGIYGQPLSLPPGEISRLEAVIQKPGRGFFVVRERDYNHLPSDAKETLTIIAKTKDRMVLKEK